MHQQASSPYLASWFAILLKKARNCEPFGDALRQVLQLAFEVRRLVHIHNIDAQLYI